MTLKEKQKQQPYSLKQLTAFTGPLSPISELTSIVSIFYLIYEGARKSVLLLKDNLTHG